MCPWTLSPLFPKQWVHLCEYVCGILGAPLPKRANTGYVLECPHVYMCMCVCLLICVFSAKDGKAKAAQLGMYLFPRL